MNHYYATGAPIFEGPGRKMREAPYGTIGWLERYILEKGLTYKYILPKDACQRDLHIFSKNNVKIKKWDNYGWFEGEYDEFVRWIDSESEL